MNNHFRKEWATRGYSDRAASAAVAPPPPIGFRRAYHLTTADHAISDIVFSRIKVARFNDLNDPFELQSYTVRTPDERVRLIDHNTDVNNKYGLVCFSGDWIDPVLWSHYGAKHCGIALGFDLHEAKVIEVTYAADRLPLANVDRDTVAKHLSTKFKSWSYEREWRILVDLQCAVCEGDVYFEPFSKDVRLREVILGARCTLALDATRKIVDTHHPNVVTIKARQADRSFGIVPDEWSVPALPATTG